MGLSVRVENQIHEEMDRLYDDRDESFISICESGPVASVRRGIVRHGDIMLNRFQLQVLIDEIGDLPTEAVTDGVSGIVVAAERAIRLRSYLYFLGD